VTLKLREKYAEASKHGRGAPAGRERLLSVGRFGGGILWSGQHANAIAAFREACDSKPNNMMSDRPDREKG